MRNFKLSVLLSVAGAVAAGALLFWTSQNVQQAENRLAYLKRAAGQEEQSIRVLKAEWAYLNRPERLEYLATEYLALSAAAAFNVSDDVSDLPDAFLPALPDTKPVLEAQPVSLSGKRVSPLRVPVPRAKPRRSQPGDFRTLLNAIGKEEGGYGE